MPAESQLETDVFAEVVVVVVEDAPVDDHVVMHLDARDVPDLLVDDLLADHDVLDILVDNLLDLDELALAHLLDDDDLAADDLLDLDLKHVVHAEVVVDHLLADDLAAQDVSLLLVDLFLFQDDAVELFVVDLEEDLLLLLDALLVDERSLVEFVLVLSVLDVLLSPEGDVADYDVPEELAGHDGNLLVHLDVHCRCVETTLLHKMLPRDGSIRDVHLDTSRDPDTDDANVLDAIHDVYLDDTNLLDAILLLVVLLLPIHLLMDDVAIVVHLVPILDVDVPLLLLPLLRP